MVRVHEVRVSPRGPAKAKESELPSTLQRFDDKAKRTFAKTHDAAADQYGECERAASRRLQRAEVQLREGR
jgi:hypothetical protein